MTPRNVARVPRPVGETLHHARVQFDFLARSCGEYDNGNFAEAQRIASALRMLLHQTRMSHSLLGQCGVLEKLWLYDSAGQFLLDDPASVLGWVGVTMEVDPDDNRIKRAMYIPKLANIVGVQPTIPFQLHELMEGRKAPRGPGFHLRAGPWWTQTVMRDTAGREFSRRILVLCVANTDGGAHVDPELDADYYALSRLNSASIHAGHGNNSFSLAFGGPPTEKYKEENQMIFTEMGSPVPACIRQIAWELMRSVKGQFPELVESTA